MNISTGIHAGTNPKVTIEPIVFKTFVLHKLVIDQGDSTHEFNIYTTGDLQIELLKQEKHQMHKYIAAILITTSSAFANDWCDDSGDRQRQEQLQREEIKILKEISKQQKEIKDQLDKEESDRGWEKARETIDSWYKIK